MRVRAAHWFAVLALIPALIAITCQTSYALFRCDTMRIVQTHCCCSAQANAQDSNDCVERGSCCAEEIRTTAAPSSDLLRAELHVFSPVTVSLLPIAWLYPTPAAHRLGIFAHESRAQGPPILLLKQSLLR